MSYKIFKQKGLASIFTLIGIVVVSIALPIATKLVQQNQENRSQAALPTCSYSSNAYSTKCDGNKKCTCNPSTGSWSCITCVYGCATGNCILPNPPTATPTQKPTATPTKTPTPTPKTCSYGGVTYVIGKAICQGKVPTECLSTGSWKYFTACAHGCSGNGVCNPPPPTATPTKKPTATPTQKPTATPTPKPRCSDVGGFCSSLSCTNGVNYTPGQTSDCLGQFCCKPTPTQKPTATPTKKPTATPTQKPTATPTPKPRCSDVGGFCSSLSCTNGVNYTPGQTSDCLGQFCCKPTPTQKPTATPTSKPTCKSKNGVCVSLLTCESVYNGKTISGTDCGLICCENKLAPTKTPTITPTKRPTATPTIIRNVTFEPVKCSQSNGICKKTSDCPATYWIANTDCLFNLGQICCRNPELQPIVDPENPNNGQCNTTNRYKCLKGTPENEGENDSYYTWRCKGVGYGGTVSCQIAKAKCGSMNAKSAAIRPKSGSETCIIGHGTVEWIDQTAEDGKYNWKCKGISGDVVYCYSNKDITSVLALSVALSPKQIELIVGKTQQIISVVQPETATNKALYWSSSNGSAVSVGMNGQIKALKPTGNSPVTIKARTSNGKEATVSVTVVSPPCSSTNCSACNESNCSRNNCIWNNNTSICRSGDGSLAQTTCKGTTGTVKKCVGDYLYTCISGSPQWSNGSPENCLNGCDTTNNKCKTATTVICTSGTYKCEGNYLRRCNSTGTAWLESANCKYGCENSKCSAKCGSADKTTINHKPNGTEACYEGGIGSITEVSGKYSWTCGDGVVVSKINCSANIAASIVASSCSKEIDGEFIADDNKCSAVQYCDRSTYKCVSRKMDTKICSGYWECMSNKCVNGICGASNIYINNLRVDPSTIELVLGESKTLRAIISPDNASNKKISWGSNNANIVSVDVNGKITANLPSLNNQSVIITAKTTDGSQKSATVTVKVKGVVIEPGNCQELEGECRPRQTGCSPGQPIYNTNCDKINSICCSLKTEIIPTSDIDEHGVCNTKKINMCNYRARVTDIADDDLYYKWKCNGGDYNINNLTCKIPKAVCGSKNNTTTSLRPSLPGERCRTGHGVFGGWVNGDEARGVYEWKCNGVSGDIANCSANKKNDTVCSVNNCEACPINLCSSVGCTWVNALVKCKPPCTVQNGCSSCFLPAPCRKIGCDWVGESCQTKITRPVCNSSVNKKMLTPSEASAISVWCNSGTMINKNDKDRGKISWSCQGTSVNDTVPCELFLTNGCWYVNKTSRAILGDIGIGTLSGGFLTGGREGTINDKGGTKYRCTSNGWEKVEEIINGFCGNADGKSFYFLTELQQQGLCLSGEPSPKIPKLENNIYSWNCVGTETYGDIDPCTAKLNIDGKCSNLSNEKGRASMRYAPVGGWCSAGEDPKQVVTDEYNNSFYWTCGGINDGKKSDICWVNRILDGKCNENLGNLQPKQKIDFTGKFMCINSDSVATGVELSQDKINFDGKIFSWVCPGQNGGISKNCTLKATIDGKCNKLGPSYFPPIKGWCLAGKDPVETEVNIDQKKNTFSWTCGGIEGGKNSPICYMDRKVDGVCNPDYDKKTFDRSDSAIKLVPRDILCTRGNVENHSQAENSITWTCQGINNGISQKCETYLTNKCPYVNGNSAPEGEIGKGDLSAGKLNGGKSDSYDASANSESKFFKCTKNGWVEIIHGKCNPEKEKEYLKSKPSIMDKTLCLAGNPIQIEESEDKKGYIWKCSGNTIYDGTVSKECSAKKILNIGDVGCDGKNERCVPGAKCLENYCISSVAECNSYGGKSGCADYQVCKETVVGNGNYVCSHNAFCRKSLDDLSSFHKFKDVSDIKGTFGGDLVLCNLGQTYNEDNNGSVYARELSISSTMEGGKKFSWTCKGKNGTSENCSMIRTIDGSCKTFTLPLTAKPADTDVCMYGVIPKWTDSDGSNDGTYNWECGGFGEGKVAKNCVAQKKAASGCKPLPNYVLNVINLSDLTSDKLCEFGEHDFEGVIRYQNGIFSWRCLGFNDPRICTQERVKNKIGDDCLEPAECVSNKCLNNKCIGFDSNCNIFGGPTGCTSNQECRQTATLDGGRTKVYRCVTAGVCGSAKNGSFYNSEEVTNKGLCSFGIPQPGAPTLTENIFSWSCMGVDNSNKVVNSNIKNTDINDPCTAKLKMDGRCNEALTTYASMRTIPEGTNLCLVDGDNQKPIVQENNEKGIFSWSCEGANGGKTVDCQMKKIIDGICSTRIGSVGEKEDFSNQKVCWYDADGRIEGYSLSLDKITLNEEKHTWNWTCPGKNGGTSKACSTEAIVVGRCNQTTIKKSYTDVSPLDKKDPLCESGTPIWTNQSSLPDGSYNWECKGINNENQTDNCSATRIKSENQCSDLITEKQCIDSYSTAHNGCVFAQGKCYDKCDRNTKSNCSEIWGKQVFTKCEEINGVYYLKRTECKSNESCNELNGCFAKGKIGDYCFENNTCESNKCITDGEGVCVSINSDCYLMQGKSYGCAVGETCRQTGFVGGEQVFKCGYDSYCNPNVGDNYFQARVKSDFDNKVVCINSTGKEVKGSELSINGPTVINGQMMFSWTCKGSNGGLNENCSITKTIDATCNEKYNKKIFEPEKITSIDDWCSDGTMISRKDQRGLVTWTCQGIRNGENDSCRLYLTNGCWYINGSQALEYDIGVGVMGVDKILNGGRKDTINDKGGTQYKCTSNGWVEIVDSVQLESTCSDEGGKCVVSESNCNGTIITSVSGCTINNPICCKTNNYVSIDRVDLNVDSLELRVGDSQTVRAIVYPQGVGINQITWKSYSAGVASVVMNGNIKALAPGKAIIEVKVEDTNGKEVVDTVMVNVINPVPPTPTPTNTPTPISIDKPTATPVIKVGFDLTFVGVRSNSKCLLSDSVKLNLELVNISTGKLQQINDIKITPVKNWLGINRVNKNGDQVFRVSGLTIDSKFYNVDNNNQLKIKSASILGKIMCINNQEKYQVSNCNLDLTTNGYIYNFSNYSLLTGDLDNNGTIDANDLSIIKSKISVSNKINCGQEGDVNFDGLVNDLDLNIVESRIGLISEF